MIHGGNVWAGGDPADWLDYSANIRPGGPPEWVRAALVRAMDNVPYYPQLTMERSRTALGRFMGLPPEMVLPTAGGIAAISLATQLKVDHVRIPAPAFVEYSQLSERSGLTVELTPLLGADHRILPLRESLCRNLAENTCVWLCNPSNPIGCGFSTDEVGELLSAVEERRGVLVVDEAFIDYCPESSVRDRVCPDLTVVGSLTKALCIPGIRLGYICASPQNIAELEKRVRPWQVNALALAVAENLPGHLEELRRDAAENEKRRQWLSRALEKEGVRTLPSLANFLLCDFGHSMAGTVQTLREQGILVRTCESFGLGASWLRLAVRTREENEHLMEALKACPK